MNVSRRSLLTASAAATAAFAATALSACTTSASSPGAGGSDSSSDDAAPVTIKHIYGTTEIPSTPTRVATVSWVNADTALALSGTYCGNCIVIHKITKKKGRLKTAL